MSAQDEFKNLDVGKLSKQDIQMATVLTLVNLLKKRVFLQVKSIPKNSEI
ncbi:MULTISPECIES: hypothetical protein [unclassified Peribacillus]|nr:MULTISPECIES: hypothetical protein [unclassified Peribacillus]MBK5441555.1 hypothetical protein [Peribacillus sp. TH24]MBK5480411.1 hypothetical protein [Peribacillus sp. TH16]MBK5501925.1 hypothetical protein [Peribacillus sp. TH14]